MTSQGPGRGIVWAPDSVRASLEEPVRPRIGLAGILLMVVVGCAFTWVPAFAVFALTGAVAPSVTGGAGIGEIALWALLFTALTGIVEGVTALIGKLLNRHRTRKAAENTEDGPAWRTILRVARHTAQTAVIAAVVLTPQGLGAAQVAWLACGLAVLINVLPVAAANLLRRRRRPAG
ncbi:hypothetical protein AB0H83_49005 [Dactylosporangium sp. NPDC050688]|uniref:hypothetical protein n=1 Tax=Dactylosporangium sp. NPDC050688 TaxID=3157217 RepID=UPI00340116C3